MQINNSDLMLDVSEAFASLKQNETARKALEYALSTRASQQSQKNQRKVQEFLLQVSKVLTEFEKQKDQNNAGYAEQADDQINQIYNDILIRPAVVARDDGIASLLLSLYLQAISQ